MHTKKQVGLQLRKYRIWKGIKTPDLAAQTGTNINGISLLELGRKNISLTNLIEHLAALDLQLDFKPLEKQPVITDEYLNL